MEDLDSEEQSRLEEEGNRMFRVAPKGKESRVQGLRHIAEGSEDDDEEHVDSLDGERDDATELANRQLDGLESWLEELVSAYLCSALLSC